MPSLTIAVAGGTGRLGLTIVKALKRSKHTVIILSRKPSGSNQVAPVIPVDYNDVDMLQNTLSEHNVHTVISTMSLFTEAEGAAQLHLITAADNCRCTRRFIPSEWSIPLRENHVQSLPSIHARLQAVEALRRSGLEFTLFYPGWFLDFYGIPYIETEMAPFPFAVDLDNKVAAIPGTRNVPVVFTYTQDIAQVVAASMDLKTWPEDSYIIGDKMSFNELLAVAEEVRGDKFSVVYDSIEEMKNGSVTELPAMRQQYKNRGEKERFQELVVAYAIYVENGDFDFPLELTLNARLPNIKMTGVKALLQQAWGFSTARP